MYHLLGNFHASELGFVFDTWVLPTSNSQDMSATFQRYWGNLANSGDVNVDYNKTCCSERRDSNTGSGVGGVGGAIDVDPAFTPLVGRRGIAGGPDGEGDSGAGVNGLGGGLGVD